MRSSWKPGFVDKSLIRVIRLKEKVLSTRFVHSIIIRSRRSLILSSFIGLKFGIYNGRNFFFIEINKDLVLSKFGEYAFSKKRSITIHYLNKTSRSILKKKMMMEKKKKQSSVSKIAKKE